MLYLQKVYMDNILQMYLSIGTRVLSNTAYSVVEFNFLCMVYRRIS